MDDHVLPISYAPDGLYESDIDALITEYFMVDAPPYLVTDQVAVNRHVRRLTRQNISAALRSRLVEPNQVTTDGTAA